MALKLMGKKRGMIQLFDEKGNIVVGTVIEAEPNVITQIKTKKTDGYDAIQLGFEQIHVTDARTIEKRVNRPQLGFFKKTPSNLAVSSAKHDLIMWITTKSAKKLELAFLQILNL